MSESTEGAGPALVAHSKDASTPGQNPASGGDWRGQAPSARRRGSAAPAPAGDGIRVRAAAHINGGVHCGRHGRRKIAETPVGANVFCRSAACGDASR